MQVSSFPNIALIHDHPPDWPGGGPVLLQRLFNNYPADHKIYISAFPSTQINKFDWLDAVYAQNKSIQRGRYGIGRLRLFWGCLPWSGYVNNIRKLLILHNIEVVHAVSHQFLWISSFFAAKSLGLPYVLSINDHWPSVVSSQLPKFISELIIKYIANRSNMVMGAHEGANELIFETYGIRMDGVERDGLTCAEVENRCNLMAELVVASESITIGYCGMYNTYKHEFELLQNAIRHYKDNNNIKIKIILFTELSLSDLFELGWKKDELEYNTWDSYENVNTALRKSDLLFLPMSFDQEKANLMKWGMSNKIAQYLAVGKPILSFGPDYSSNASLMSKYQIGLHVSEWSTCALKDAIGVLISKAFQMTYLPESLKCIEAFFNLDKSINNLWSKLSSLVKNRNGLEHSEIKIQWWVIYGIPFNPWGRMTSLSLSWSKLNDVRYVTPISIMDLIRTKFGRNHNNKKIPDYRKWIKHNDKLFHTTRIGMILPSFPRFWRVPCAWWINEILFGLWLRKSLNKYRYPGVKQVIVNFNWSLSWSLKLAKPDLLIYDCSDNFSKYPSEVSERVRWAEARLAQLSDIIVVSSLSLTSNFSEQHQKLYHVPNGTNSEGQDNSPRLQLNGKPIVIYHGATQSWRFDWELFVSTAMLCPEFEFHIYMDLKHMPECIALPENVSIRDWVSQDKIYDIINTCSLAFMPYRMTEPTLSGFPLKLFEYFSSGLPVVSVRLKELEQYGELVRFCQTPEDAANELRLALSENNREVIEKRQKIARQYDWNVLSEKYRQIILSNLNYKTRT